MPDEDEIPYLRSKLVGVKWGDFARHQSIVVDGVTFKACAGIFLGMDVLAVVALGKFVVVVKLNTNHIYRRVNAWVVLDPVMLEGVFPPHPYKLGDCIARKCVLETRIGANDQG